jgi:hypothetical protein
MSDSTTAASSGGIGFFGLLGIVFIVLKLVGIITWSWWWVLAPIWAPTALVLLIIFGMLVFGIIVAAIGAALD